MSVRNRVNVKAVLIILGTCAGLGVGVHFLHGFQAKRNARAVFELQLEEGAKKGANSTQIMQYLERYRTLRPDDTEGLAEYALLNEKRAKNPRERLNAYLLLEDVVRRDGRRDDVRRLAAKLGTELGRFDTAKEDLQRLLKDHPADVELMHFLARCERGLRNDTAALDWYTKVSKGSKDTKLWLEFAFYLRDRWEQNDRADELVEDMVVNDPRTAATRLEAARYFCRFARYDLADKHLRVAVKDLGSQDAELLLLAAHVSEGQADLAEARRQLKLGRKLHAKDTRFPQELARLDLLQGQREQALANLQPSLKDLPTDADQLWSLGNLLIEAGDLDRLGEVLRRLEQLRATTPKEFLRARLLMHRGTWGEARAILEKARSDKFSSPELAKYVNLFLGQCYDRLLNPDQAQEAYRRVLAIDANFQIARSGLARSLAATGKLAKAFDEYRKIDHPTSEVRVDFVRLLVHHNLSLPPTQRNWDELEGQLTHLAKAKEPPEDKQAALDLPLLRAEVLLAQERHAEVSNLLEDQRRANPKQVGVWLMLAELAVRQQTPKAALQVLNDAERHTGKQLDLELAKVNLWRWIGTAEGKSALARIEADLDRFREADQERLLMTLADGFLNLEDPAAAQRLWKRLAERQPGNLSVRVLLVEAAFAAGKIADMERLAREIKDLEGGSGPASLVAEASLRIDAARAGNKQTLPEARALLAKAAALRPSWAPVPLLEAITYELENQKERAAERYQAAFDRGETRIATVRRLVQLLYEQGRYADAQTCLNKLPDQTLASPTLSRLATDVALRSAPQGQDPTAARRQALHLAQQAAKESTDYRDYVWLGQVALLTGEDAEAEKAFRQACKLDEKNQDTWVALVLFLARTDPKRAEAELVRAEQTLDKDRAPLALALGCEALGKLEQAEEHYRRVLAQKPGDPLVLRQVAGFYGRTGQSAKAEPYLRKLIDPHFKAAAATVPWARRELAVTLAFQGGYPQFREARALLAENRKSNGDSLEDRQAEALVLATQPAHRREAVQLFENLSSGQALVAPAVQFWLAQVYDADGNWPKSRAHMLALLRTHGNNMVYLARYVKTLLRRGEIQEAQVWAEKLADAGQKTFEAIELRALVLKAANRNDEAVSLVNDYARQKDARLEQAGHLLDQLGEAGAAEKVYREYVTSSKKPDSVLVLAQHLARHKRLGEALELCEKAWTTCDPEAVGYASVFVLKVADGGDQAQQQRVERWLTDAIRKQPRSVSLVAFLADLQDYRGRYAEAMALYRNLLEKSPRDILAMNNLAYLLALTEGKTAEALELMKTAMDLAGPDPEFLDTRAVIYLKNNQAALAVKDLHEAIRQTPSGNKYFHLAQAHQAADDRPAAREAFRKATAMGMKLADVPLLERSAFQSLTEWIAR